MIWIINTSGIVLIALIVWWFWLSSNKRTVSTDTMIQTVVENGIYSPSHITVKKGQPLVLQFFRKDPSPCAEQVIFDKLNLSVSLPVDRKTSVKVPTQQPGKFEFTCQMQMYRGVLEIE